MKSREAARKGSLVAEVLAGAWRASAPPSLQISERELDEVTPLLYDSGTAALGWRRVSKTQLRASSSAEVLHQAYRLQSLQSEIHEQKITKVFRLLRQAQVEAILGKGWATARMYAEKALRPYGDIDICVRPEHFKLAEETLRLMKEQLTTYSHAQGQSVWEKSRFGYSGLKTSLRFHAFIF
jgi:hypothetical protein